MDVDFNNLLENYYLAALQDMLKLAGLPVVTDSGRKLLKKEIIALLARELVSPERIQTTYRQLNEPERAVLDHIRLRSTPFPRALLQRQLVAAGIVQPAPAPAGDNRFYRRSYEGSPTPRSSLIFEDVLARLTQFGLVFSQPQQSSYDANRRQTFGTGGDVVVPAAIARHLPPPAPPVDRLADWQPDQVISGDPLLTVRELYLYWDFCRRDTIMLLKNGQVGKRSLKAISERLIVPADVASARGEGDLPYLQWLRETLQQQRMLTAVDGGLQAVDRPTFWQSSARQLVEGMLAVWRRTPALLEADNRPTYDMRPERAFDALWQTLAAEDAQGWLAVADLAARISARTPYFYFPQRQQVEESTTEVYRFGETYFSSTAALLAKLDGLELAFVQRMIDHALLPLGIVEVGKGLLDGKPLQALRLSAFGRAVLQNAAYELPGQAGRVIVQPTFQVLALGQVPLSTLAQIDRFAERVKVDRNVFEYTLTRDSVYAAQQQGMATADVIAFLEQAGDNPLPQNVQRSLAEWGARHERIVFRTAVTLMQTADAAQLSALKDAPATAPAIGDRLSDCIALVKAGKQALLQKALLAEGLLPTRDRGDRRENSVTIAADGYVTSDRPTQSLFVNGQLAQIAEQQADGTWRITRRAFQRRAGSKDETTHYLAELARLHSGELPAELVRQIKTWGSYYGKVEIGTLTLVAFQDAETLAELVQHPPLKGLLMPFPDARRPLAVIPTAAVDRVRDYLQQLGVDVQPYSLDGGAQ